jgi:hypothetical protein
MRRITVTFDVPPTDGKLECNKQAGDLWWGWNTYGVGQIVGCVVSNEPVETDKERADRLQIEVNQLQRAIDVERGWRMSPHGNDL